jgi:uncharacterized protein (TIGR02145 family)
MATSVSENIFTDPRDGKVYRTVKIGDQVWMAENLNYEAPGSVYYRKNKYGRLYSFEAAEKAVPPGWHLPNKEEWNDLVQFVGGDEIAGKHLKARSGWNDLNEPNDGNGTDDFGFSALPGGSDYGDVGYFGNWWSSTYGYGEDSVYCQRLFWDGEDTYGTDFFENDLLNVRCIQDKIISNSESVPKVIVQIVTKFNPQTDAENIFTDLRDGKVYRTVKIGEQVWMAENLSYEATYSVCYGNDPKNGEKYGRLYNWNTAKDAVPPGWHLPTNEEWDQLLRYADGTNGTESPYKSFEAGKYLKARRDWKKYGGNGTDNFGFAALPGGYGMAFGLAAHYGTSDFYGCFNNIGGCGNWWSANEKGCKYAYTRYIVGDGVYWGIDNIKLYSYSVRCVQN